MELQEVAATLSHRFDVKTAQRAEQERRTAEYYKEQAKKHTPEGVKAIYRDLSTVLANSGGRKQQDVLVSQFLCDHPCLQNDLGLMMVRALLGVALQTTGPSSGYDARGMWDGPWTDMRNERLVTIAHRIVDALGEDAKQLAP